jgi:hypothetical protein
MKIKLVLAGVLVLVTVGLITVLMLKTEETVLSASYQMLACENCFHMTVEKSEDSKLVGETIIPVSDVVDIEEMINGIAISKEHLCLRGRFYRFSFNLLKINPNGKKFEVMSIEEDPNVCSELRE